MRAEHPFLARRRLMEAEGLHEPWLLLFDIDSTLMDTGLRNLAILEAARAETPALQELWSRLELSEPFWDVLEPFRRSRLGDEALHAAVKAFWRERFFTDEWLSHDRPYPGVAPFLQNLKAEGFTLAYLTGRHSPGMEKGTRRSFLDHGLPAGADEHFFFKPDFGMGDAEFKASVCEGIRSMGSLVATVDNEPANVNLFRRAFPEALVIWLDTVTSPQPEKLLPGIERRGIDFFLDL
ncbi:MAG TPA: HAD family hydrolase [Rectinemataceae bacterium]|nr:HAD family hydrolase [Rectinemataceae bacterium]